jgi:tRNA threonylcarbamoyladenosine biosynthesis protein TsaE
MELAVQKIKFLNSPDHTARLARAFAPLLSSGNTILLQGSVGAGKTHFSRQLILARLAEFDAVEDVPSPTFTLVQTYELKDTEIWHADLYRLSDTSEVYELGLEAAFETAICLVEWPGRLGELTPDNALTLTLKVTGDNSRTAELEWQSDTWDPIVETALEAI